MTVEKPYIRRLRGALRQVARIAGAQDRDCCAPVTMAQCHVLLRIDADQTSTTTDLAEALNLDTSTISRTVDSLVGEGLVKRAENPQDRRSIVLSLTSKGRDLCQSINSEADAYFDRVIGCIPPSDRKAVLTAVEVLAWAFVEASRKREQSGSCCSGKAS